MNKKIFLSAIIILTLMFIFTLSIIKQSRQITVKPTIKPLIEEKAVILPVSENDPMFGNPGSPITIA